MHLLVKAKEDAMSSGPSNDPVVQQLQLLLSGYGYNFYSAINQARSDDLLVRQRATYHLNQAVDMLARLRVDYQQRFIPPLTRAHPDPPQEVMAQVREIEAVQQALQPGVTHSWYGSTSARPYLVALPPGASTAGAVAQFRSSTGTW